MTAGLVGAGALALGGIGLCGCVSTQRKNERARLVAERTLAGRRPLRLGAHSRAVRVERVALVRGGRGGALVVTLRNRGARALADVPIAVGVRAADGRRTRLNGGRGRGWFATHLPSIGAGERATWVFTTRRALPGGRPWAVAGAARGPLAGTLPRIAARAVRPRDTRADGAPARRAARHPAVRVLLENDSDVPQYGLQVYAVVRDGGRIVAAGRATVAHLGTRGRASARLALIGAPGRHAARVHALPTIFD